MSWKLSSVFVPSSRKWLNKLEEMQWQTTGYLKVWNCFCMRSDKNWVKDFPLPYILKETHQIIGGMEVTKDAL